MLRIRSHKYQYNLARSENQTYQNGTEQYNNRYQIIAYQNGRLMKILIWTLETKASQGTHRI